MRLAAGLRPDPLGGSLQHSPRPPSWILGVGAGKGGKGREDGSEEGREGKGERGGEKREVKRERGRNGTAPSKNLVMGLLCVC